MLLFSLCSRWLSPVWWFALVSAGLLYFLRPRHWLPAALCVLAPLAVWAPSAYRIGIIQERFPDTYWSPYYRINYAPAPERAIVVNLIGHQHMSRRAEPFPAYALPIWSTGTPTGQASRTC